MLLVRKSEKSVKSERKSLKNKIRKSKKALNTREKA
jgi:hypothetical protein